MTRGVVRISRSSYDLIVERLDHALRLLAEYRSTEYRSMLEEATRELAVARGLFGAYDPDVERFEATHAGLKAKVGQ